MYIVRFRLKPASPAQVAGRRIYRCAINVILNITDNSYCVRNTKNTIRERDEGRIGDLCYQRIGGVLGYVYRIAQNVRSLIALSGRTVFDLVPLHFVIYVRDDGGAGLFVRIRHIFQSDFFRLVPYIQQVVLVGRVPDGCARPRIRDWRIERMNFISYALGLFLHFRGQTRTSVVDIDSAALIQGLRTRIVGG